MCSAETTRRLDQWDTEHPNPNTVSSIFVYLLSSIMLQSYLVDIVPLLRVRGTLYGSQYLNLLFIVGGGV